MKIVVLCVLVSLALLMSGSGCATFDGDWREWMMNR